jgi:transcriptional regulator with XRE-family HTH domain
MGYSRFRQKYSAHFGSFPETGEQRRNLSLLGQAIREIRQRRGLTTHGLATAAGVDEQRVAAVESGQLDADFELLLKLAGGMGLRPSAFILRAEELAVKRAGGESPE